MELVIVSFWLMLMLFILRLAYSVLQTHQKTSRQYHSKKTSIHKHKDKVTAFQIPRPSVGRNIHHPQWRKLLRLVHGDVDTANRLIDCERRKNPDRSFDWCIDKAIWQLQRDRR